MKQPIAVTVDDLYPVCYVEYESFEKKAHSSALVVRDHDGQPTTYWGERYEPLRVTADLDEYNRVVGIEILNVDEEDAVALARDFALAKDLDFPDDSRAAAAGGAGHPAA